ncbi:hypothetical protein [Paenibacillus sacheonensis]|uniref:Uncharacterized protein n=1 Tax=Paenibacillus sacheonensis TaxID=742054 RepID=A0A7X5BX65_9BACL|nr:hypothetical protein [Paenibacillus sacheonensis]MBM7563170.1 hypothetical protein [Paenibacillus sacheonensis]NBC68267.1 hypothetical protein [Paenibacillus sacheonensis]
MIRYFYYHVFYVGMINIMMFVPTLLIRDRFHGAVSGMLVAIAISSVMSLVTMACFERFPGLGYPEISDLYLPRWLTKVNILSAALFVWLPSGIIVLYSYAETARMFFYPDMPPLVNLILLAGAAAWASCQSTRTVQFIQEIAMVLITPLIILFLLKAITNENMNWDAIRYVAGYVRIAPSFITIAASTFLFSGYMSLVLFNRMHEEGFKFKFRWVVPLFSSLFLAVTFFVPIGFHGTVGVQEYVYLWSMTADSMALDYGFINRVLYVFLLMFTGISLLYVMNTWHTTIHFIRYTLNGYKSVEETPASRINIWFSVGIGAAAFVYMYFISTEENQRVSEVWIITRFFVEILTVFMMLYFVWRQKKSKSKNKPRAEAQSAAIGKAAE